MSGHAFQQDYQHQLKFKIQNKDMSDIQEYTKKEAAHYSGAPEIIPNFRLNSNCSVFGYLCFVLCIFGCRLIFHLFDFGVVSLKSSYEVRCPVGIFQFSISKRVFLLQNDV